MIAPGGRQLVLLESHGAAGRHPCVGHHIHQELQNHWELDTSTELMDPVNCGTPVANPDGYRTATEARPCIYLNQFMQIHAGTPSRDKSRFTTDFNTVQKRPRMCWARTGVRPSLLTVDHFVEGDVVGAVNAVNTLDAAGDWQSLAWGGLADGTTCFAGQPVASAPGSNAAAFWPGPFTWACGTEPMWDDGGVLPRRYHVQPMRKRRLVVDWQRRPAPRPRAVLGARHDLRRRHYLQL